MLMYLDSPAPPWAFVAHDDLLELGYEFLREFDVVQLDDTYYELQAWLPNSDCWWIEPIDIEEEVRRFNRSA